MIAFHLISYYFLLLLLLLLLYLNRHAPIIVKINSSRYFTILYSTTGPFIPPTKPNQLRLYISKGQPAILSETQKQKAQDHGELQSSILGNERIKNRVCFLYLYTDYITVFFKIKLTVPDISYCII